MWNLVPQPGLKPGLPALGAWSLSHWTTREVPPLLLRWREGTGFIGFITEKKKLKKFFSNCKNYTYSCRNLQSIEKLKVIIDCNFTTSRTFFFVSTWLFSYMYIYVYVHTMFLYMLCISYFYFWNCLFILFCLCWIFIASCTLSLIVAVRGYS